MPDAPSVPPLHPDAAELAFLLGTWIGQGHGDYSTVSPFDYREETSFWHVGKPFLAYGQRTWALDDGRPLHSEAGFWRPKPGGVVELVVAHPTGHVEIAEGTVVGSVVSLASRVLEATTTAMSVTTLHRRLVVERDVLRYTLAMEAVGQPLQEHLVAELRRSTSAG